MGELGHSSKHSQRQEYIEVSGGRRASQPGCFTPTEIHPGTHLIAGWLRGIQSSSEPSSEEKNLLPFSRIEDSSIIQPAISNCIYYAILGHYTPLFINHGST
jgi:hypothetical protein